MEQNTEATIMLELELRAYTRTLEARVQCQGTWVAVKEPPLSYDNKETQFSTIYPWYGSLRPKPYYLLYTHNNIW